MPRPLRRRRRPVFVPAGTIHEWSAGAEGMKFLYSFAADSFDAVDYVFEAGDPPA